MTATKANYTDETEEPGSIMAGRSKEMYSVTDEDFCNVLEVVATPRPNLNTPGWDSRILSARSETTGDSGFYKQINGKLGIYAELAAINAVSKHVKP